jgi:hypothetical protein
VSRISCAKQALMDVVYAMKEAMRLAQTLYQQAIE